MCRSLASGITHIVWFAHRFINKEISITRKQPVVTFIVAAFSNPARPVRQSSCYSTRVVGKILVQGYVIHIRNIRVIRVRVYVQFCPTNTYRHKERKERDGSEKAKYKEQDLASLEPEQTRRTIVVFSYI
eukprot:TRINITY_DN5044_c0_g1_i1.p1 TRINITY_DN5044_c0_g1~~TRINITY_DN5044_c0_g1_i1.p1  ORF type:complete len:130 (+),score=1.96 TRINITY_DN5044_c0_g1_i1:140-529(+)